MDLSCLVTETLALDECLRVLPKSSISELTVDDRVIAEQRHFSSFFQALRANSSLLLLRILNCDFPPDSLPLLGHALEKHPTLRSLHLSGCFVYGEDDTASLTQTLATALANHPTCEELELTGCSITASSLIRITDLISRSVRLRSVDLKDNSLDDRGAELIAKAISNRYRAG